MQHAAKPTSPRRTTVPVIMLKMGLDKKEKLPIVGTIRSPQ